MAAAVAAAAGAAAADFGGLRERDTRGIQYVHGACMGERAWFERERAHRTLHTTVRRRARRLTHGGVEPPPFSAIWPRNGDRQGRKDVKLCCHRGGPERL
mgnify:CR=1 FL=1